MFHIKKKIRLLNQQVASEKKKWRASIRSGMAADAVYVPTLWCFNYLKFLLDANDEVRGHSSIECDIDVNATLCDSDTNEVASGSRKKRNISKAGEISALRHASNKSIEMAQKLLGNKEEDSKEVTFCKMLCSELKLLKLEETYDSVTVDLIAVVWKAKTEERKKMNILANGTQPAPSVHQSLMSQASSANISPLHNYDEIETSSVDFTPMTDAMSSSSIEFASSTEIMLCSTVYQPIYDDMPTTSLGFTPIAMSSPNIPQTCEQYPNRAMSSPNIPTTNTSTVPRKSPNTIGTSVRLNN